MPLALSFTLNAVARAGLMTIKGGVERGLSAASITETLQATTGGLAKWRLLEIMRAYKGVTNTKTHLQNLKKSAFPDVRRLAPSVVKLRRPLSFLVKVSGIFAPTGHAIVQYVTVALDKVETRAEIEQRAMDAILSDYDAYPLEDIEVIIQSGTRMGEAGIL